MDHKFRLIFACPEQTPSAEAYLAADAVVCDHLYEAIKIGSEMNMIWGVPFIAHSFLVLEPFTIELLYRELVAGAETITRTSSEAKLDSPC